MPIFEVGVATEVDAKIAIEFGAERTGGGRPSFYDFESGPLAAARLAFSQFDQQREAVGPSVRTVTIVDPSFGDVVFTAVPVAPTKVEIADVGIDPSYWDHVSQDPAG
jgi:hypothetical protein